MLREALNAFLACLVTFVLCAVAYPAVVYGLGQTLFPNQARGSLIERDGKVIGSRLIAQPFASDRYFSPRPSAAGANGYAADAASGSNLGTTNPALRDRIAADAARLVAAKTGDAGLKESLDRLGTLQDELKAKREIKEPSAADTAAITKLEKDVSEAQSKALDRSAELGKAGDVAVPVDLVTTSGAGLDPEISPEAARYQASRVAAARGLPVDRVLKLIDDRIDHSGAIIGAPPRINVLLLNLDLDKLAPGPASSTDTPSPAAQPSAPAAEVTATAPETTPSAAPVVAERPASPPEAVGRAEPSSAVEELTRRIDRLQEKVDTAPVEGLTVEVKDLKTRIAKLDEASGPSATRLAELDAKVASFERDLDSLKAERKELRDDLKVVDQIGSLDKKLQALSSQVEVLRGPAGPGAAADRAARGPDLAPAVKLFREKRYAAASGSFRALAEAYPEDARVWYFAALANGLATGQWKGETVTLFDKGVGRERAGSPATTEIDAALADLTREEGKDWVAYYRRQAGR